MNTPTTKDGTGQQVSSNMAYSKPFIPRNGNPYYNPSQYINSKLNMYGKRAFIAPNNFIGIKSVRPPNMQPNRQHTPSAMVWQPEKHGIPILTTPPIPKTFQ
jgi:hypothetical protein